MILEACLAAALTLSDAKEVFIEQCPFLERVDCDPIDGEWVCANVVLGDSAPGMPRRVGADSDLDALFDPSHGRVDGRCHADADSAGEARRAYAAHCADVRADCDEREDGWRCASYVMAPSAVADESEREPVDTSLSNAPERSSFANLSNTGIGYDGRYGAPWIGWADSYMGADGLCWIKSTFDHGAGDLEVTVLSGRTMTVREAFERLGPGPGAFADLEFNDVDCGNGPANDVGDEGINACPGLVTRGREGCSLRGSSWTDRL